MAIPAKKIEYEDMEEMRTSQIVRMMTALKLNSFCRISWITNFWPIIMWWNKELILAYIVVMKTLQLQASQELEVVQTPHR